MSLDVEFDKSAKRTGIPPSSRMSRVAAAVTDEPYPLPRQRLGVYTGPTRADPATIGRRVASDTTTPFASSHSQQPRVSRAASTASSVPPQCASASRANDWYQRRSNSRSPLPDPTGLAWNICGCRESVQAVQADGFATNNSSRQPGSNRLCGRYGTVDPDQLRQAVNHGGHLIEVAQRPNPIENHRVTAIGAHRNGGTVGGGGAPASGAGGPESQAHGPEDCRPNRIIC